jgi:flavin-dependent dehydrogenase
VICADGLARTSTRHLPEFAVSTVADSRVGIGAIVDHDDDRGPGERILMVVSHHGYVGISPISRRQINVAAAVAPSLLGQATPAEVVRAILEGAGVSVPPRLCASTWRGTPPLTSRPRRVAAERVLLVGDAGGYIEPFTGEGMAFALETAIAVAPFAVQAAERWTPSIASGWEALHRRLVCDRQLTCRQLAWILRRPWAAYTAFTMCRLLPGMARRIIAKTTLLTAPYSMPGVDTK